MLERRNEKNNEDFKIDASFLSMTKASFSALPIKHYMRKLLFIHGVLLLGFVNGLFAHGDIHEKINRVSLEINAHPDSAALYFLRGTLYQYHEDFKPAFDDFMKVKSLSPAHDEVDLSLARLCLQHSYSDSGIFYIDQFLAAHPGHVPGLFTKARLLTLSGEYRAALFYYESGMSSATTFEPENFLEIAGAVLSADPGDFDQAIQWLEQGVAELGFVIALEEQIIALEIQRANWNQALARVDSVLVQIDRKESWLVKKAEVLQLAGRNDDAKATCLEAKGWIARLPASKQSTGFVKELSNKIEKMLQQM